MTSTEFSARYRILRALTQDGIRSFTAQHTGTQRPVMLHFLDQSPGSAELLAQLDRLDATDRARVLERAEVDGMPVLVTQVLASFESLGAWLSARAAQAQTSEPPAQALLRDQEIPRLADREAPTMLMNAVSQPSNSPAPELPKAKQASSPGEFTRLFAAAASPPVEPPARVPAPAPPPAASQHAAPNAVPHSPPAAPPRAAEPGEFTRMFRQASVGPAEAPAFGALPPSSASPPLSVSPHAPPPLVVPPAAAPPPAPIRSSSPIAGTATGALDARPLAPQPPPAAREAAPSPTSMTPGAVPLDFPPPLLPSLITPPSQGAGPAAPLPSPAAMPPARPGFPHGPSEFTRVIAGPAQPAPAGGATATPAAVTPQAIAGSAPTSAAGESSAAASPGTKGAARLPLVPLLVGVNLIVLAALALVLYFALKS